MGEQVRFADIVTAARDAEADYGAHLQHVHDGGGERLRLLQHAVGDRGQNIACKVLKQARVVLAHAQD